MTDIKRKNHDRNMLMAAVPLIICGTVLYSARVLLLCAVAVLTAKAVDVAVSMARREAFDYTDHSSELSAVVFCLMLPVNIPLYIVVVSVCMAVLVSKHFFGGKDVYPFNLAALAMCCAAVNWQEKVFVAVTPFSKVDFWSGYTTGATVTTAGIVKDGGVPAHDTLNLLLGNHPGSMGSDFVLVIAAIGIYLVLTKKITWHIPVSFLATCTVISLAFPRVYGFPRLESLQMEMLNGIVLFTALFMLTEPATTPSSPKAKIIYGVMAGVLGMVFRYFGGFEYGSCFAVLLVNTMDGVIERFANGEHKKADKKPAKAVQEKPAKKVHCAQPKAKKDTMDIISEAEDNIDEVIYSTRTISIDEILKAEAEMNKNKKGGK